MLEALKLGAQMAKVKFFYLCNYLLWIISIYVLICNNKII
jgi:hypothetical protein